MYLQCKYGFVEADRWDGSTIPVAAQAEEVRVVKKKGAVIVVRSRRRATIVGLVSHLRRKPKVFESPPDWDYEFRAYVTAGEWASVLATIVEQLDYRNFKSWCARNAPDQAHLAHAVWQVAYDDASD